MNNSGTTTSSTLSNQPTGDQRVANAAPTPGPWRVAPSSSYRGSEINIDAGPNGTGGFICVAGHRGDLEAEANAALIAEAGTIFHEIGLTPQQLRETVKELSDTLLKLRPLGGSECFVRKGDGFYVADTRYFAQLIEQERVSTHEARKGKVRAEKQRDELLAALKRADQFITNGIALGFIRMPDAATPDPAHETPGIVRAAIAKVEGRS